MRPDRLLPLRVLRLANPVIRALLRSRMHGLWSGRLLLLTYRGHRSGRTFEIPLRYARAADGELVVLAVDASRKLWWRSFELAETSASALVRRERLAVTGRLVRGQERDAALDAYVRRYPYARAFTSAAEVVLLALPR
jgi:NADPH:quinone reductase